MRYFTNLPTKSLLNNFFTNMFVKVCYVLKCWNSTPVGNLEKTCSSSGTDKWLAKNRFFFKNRALNNLWGVKSGFFHDSELIVIHLYFTTNTPLWKKATLTFTFTFIVALISHTYIILIHNVRSFKSHCLCLLQTLILSLLSPPSDLAAFINVCSMQMSHQVPDYSWLE